MRNIGKWTASAICVLLLVLDIAVGFHRSGIAEVKADIPTAIGSVGQKLPDFSLQDIDGNTVTLSQFYGKGPVLLTFERSVDW